MNNGYSNGPPRPGFQPYRSRLPHHPPAPSQAPVASTSAAAASTSHHRPEDAQPNESVAFHRPQAPPQIAVVPPPPPPLAPFPRPPQQNSSARGRGRGALVGGGRGRGTGSNASIFMPRKGAGRGSVAGSWAPSSRPGGASASSAFPAPPQGPSGLSTSKGKEKEVAPSLPSRPAFPMSVPAPPSAPSRPAKASSAPTFYGVPKGPRASYPPATAVSVPQNAAYVPRAPVQPAGTSARLFISSIPNGATADELRYIFAPYGTITDVRISNVTEPSPSNTPSAPPSVRTFAHVSYSSYDEAGIALATLDNSIYPDFSGSGSSSKRIKVKYAAESRVPHTVNPRSPPPHFSLPPRPPSPSSAAATSATAVEPIVAVRAPSPVALFGRGTATPAPELLKKEEGAPHSSPIASTSRLPFPSPSRVQRQWGAARGAPGEFLEPPSKLSSLSSRHDTPSSTASSSQALGQVRPSSWCRPHLVFSGKTIKLGPAIVIHDDWTSLKFSTPTSLQRGNRKEAHAAFLVDLHRQIESQGGTIKKVKNARKKKSNWIVMHVAFPEGGAILDGAPLSSRAATVDEAEEESSLWGDDDSEMQSVHDGVSMDLDVDQDTTTTTTTNVLPPPPPPVAAPAAPPIGEYVDASEDEGLLVERVPLPESCRGPSEGAKQARLAFRKTTSARARAEGKDVLNTKIKGDVLELYYDPVAMDEDVEYVVAVSLPPPASTETPRRSSPSASRPPHIPPTPAPAPTPSAPVQASAPAPRPAATPRGGPDADHEDIKPRVSLPTPEMDEEYDQLVSPTPEPPDRDPVLFPVALHHSTVDSLETKKHVEAFLVEFFDRFDSSRMSLEYIYSPHSVFSVRIINTPPERSTNTTPFSKRFQAASGKVTHTPTAIVNVIQKLPPGSHDLTKIVYDAHELPTLQARKGKSPPILLHLQAEFEEFPEKVVRSVMRTFVLVPRNAMSGGGSPLKYLIQSDHVTFAHRVPNAPSALRVLPPRPPLVLSPTPEQPLVRQQPAPAPQPPSRPAPLPSTSSGPAAAAPMSAPRDDPPPARRQSPIAAPPPPPPAHRHPEKRPRSPAPAPAASTSTAQTWDVLTLESSDEEDAAPPPPPAKRANRRSSDARFPFGTEPAPPSTTSLGKRRAASPQSTAMARGHSRDSTVSIEESVRARVQAATTTKSKDKDKEAAAPPLTNEQIAAMEAMIDRRIKAELAARQGASTGSTHRERVTLPSSDDSEMAIVPPVAPVRASSDARIVIPGGSTSVLHSFTGKNNKLRWMVDAGDSCLAIATCGDIIEWTGPSSTGSSRSNSHGIRKFPVRHTSETFRVDDFAWSAAKSTLVVGYLGAKIDKVQESPPHQVVLFKREKDSKGASSLVATPLKDKPHAAGGITATAVVPGAEKDRLRFVTAGEDKSIYLWSRARSDHSITTERFNTSHSSMITALDWLPQRDWLVSGSKDKRVIAYDPTTQRSCWSTILYHSVLAVEAIPADPNLILARMGAASDQFSVFDLRASGQTTPAMTFGIRLAARPSTTKDRPQLPTLGRYLRGSFRDFAYAHPDNDAGVKLWDLRNVKDGDQPRSQHLVGAGRGRVAQVLWRGSNELALLELSNLTSLQVR